MTEQDEIDLYNEGYRDGLRAALKHEELTTMNIQERADYEIMLARTKAHNRGATAVEIQRNVERLAMPTYPPYPECECRVCVVLRGYTVTETPLTDFEHVTL